MQFVGKLVTSVSDFYRDLNPATLTGAMDVIVVEDPDTGERSCTPFHVRIGKLHLMRPQDKRVEVLINGESVEGIEMKVGEAGEAFFVVPEEALSRKENGDGSGEEELQLLSTSPLPPPLASSSPSSRIPEELSLSPEKKKADITGATRYNSLKADHTPLSDTEIDYSQSPATVLQKELKQFSEPWMDIFEYLRDEGRIRNQLIEMRTVNNGPHAVVFFQIPYPLRVFPPQDFPMIIEHVCHRDNELKLDDFLKMNEKFLDPVLYSKLIVSIGDTWWFEGRTALIVGLCCAIFSRPPDPDRDKSILFPPSRPPPSTDLKPLKTQANSVQSSWRHWWSRSNVESIVATTAIAPSPNQPAILQSPLPRSPAINLDASAQSPLQPPPSQQHPAPAHVATTKRFLKSLRLTTDQLAKLPLKPGPNTIMFTFVTGRSCQSRIFLWPNTARIVISDIDGTITKSDALGHIFTFVGRDWTHSGVAGLFDRIYRNGYKFLYLTARAIGQAGSTRDYLRGVEQDKCQLPDGPVIMSPDRLLAALRREVIVGNPEEFKIACLNDIKKLFPHADPFYAGFGNRFTDAQSYHAVGIPPHRIFTVEPSGSLRIEHGLGYASTYLRMMDIADLFFPPVVEYPHPAVKTVPRSASNVSVVREEYQDFSFWKRPVVHKSEDLAQFLPPPLATAVVAGDNIIIIEPQEVDLADMIGEDMDSDDGNKDNTSNSHNNTEEEDRGPAGGTYAADNNTRKDESAASSPFL